MGQITQMKQVEGTSLLVTIAVRLELMGVLREEADEIQEDMSSEPVLKVWSLDKPVKKTGLPTCQSELRIKNGQKQFPVSDGKKQRWFGSY